MKKIKLIINCLMYVILTSKDYIIPITVNGNEVNELFNTKANKTIKLLQTTYLSYER